MKKHKWCLLLLNHMANLRQKPKHYLCTVHAMKFYIFLLILLRLIFLCFSLTSLYVSAASVIANGDDDDDDDTAVAAATAMLTLCSFSFLLTSPPLRAKWIILFLWLLKYNKSERDRKTKTNVFVCVCVCVIAKISCVAVDNVLNG